MAIGQVVTGGLGNGTLTTTIPLVLLRGLVPASVATTQICVHNARIHSAELTGEARTADLIGGVRTARVDNLDVGCE